MTGKVICKDCRKWHGDVSDLLCAPNPFIEDDSIYACPGCRSHLGIAKACSHEGCWQEVTCGAPTQNGYAWTCGLHAR